MQWSIFDKVRRVWIADHDEMLSQVVDISSQLKQKKKDENGEVKLSKSMLIRPGIQSSFFMIVIFFVLT